MSLANISTIQALDIWTDLEEARAGTHGFGGDIAEIYVHRALPYVPAVMTPGSSLGPTSKLAGDTYTNAFEAFKALFLEFQKRRDCLVYYSLSPHAENPGFDSSHEWVLAEHMEGILTDHRFYIRIGASET